VVDRGPPQPAVQAGNTTALDTAVLAPLAPALLRPVRRKLHPARQVIGRGRHRRVRTIAAHLPLQPPYPLLQRRVGLQKLRERDQLLARQLLQPGHNQRSSPNKVPPPRTDTPKINYRPECSTWSWLSGSNSVWTVLPGTLVPGNDNSLPAGYGCAAPRQAVDRQSVYRSRPCS
jgi:hypothetical protein